MIRFPRMHIAASVMNRIANALEGDTPLAIDTPPPIVPDPAAEDALVTEMITAPAAPATSDAPASAVSTGQQIGLSPLESLLTVQQ